MRAISSGVVDEIWLAADVPVYSPTREPTRCSRLAEHALPPGAVTSRLGSKLCRRAARAEAARAMVAVARFYRRLSFLCTSTIGVPVELSMAAGVLVHIICCIMMCHTWYTWNSYYTNRHMMCHLVWSRVGVAPVSYSNKK